ncbi:MAG: mechanosensitive ion channel [Thermoanaerobaculia bacterium]|nr:mechanosensitive ion channel [Thermoanaerobaculia bacterium]
MNGDGVSELDSVPGALLGSIPALLLALLVLTVGWLLALGLASLVRALLARTTLDNEMAAWVEEEAPPRRVEVAVGRVVFWLTMAGVLVIFLRILGLAHAVQPLRDFLSELLGFLPGLLAALGVALLAWVVATLLRGLLRFGLERVQFDRRVGGGPTAEVEEAAPQAPGGLTASVADALYWLVFLLFLPAVLSALGLGELLGPVRRMFQAGLGFMPSALSAALLLGLGWLVARISQKLVTNLASALGLDRLGRAGGPGALLGHRPLSGVVGLVVYVLVLVPVLIVSLNALGIEAVTEPATALLQRFLVAVPRMFAAALVVVIAYVIGRLVAGLVASLLAAAGFDTFVAGLGLLRPASARAAREGRAGSDAELGDTTRRRPSELLGYALLVAMMLFAAIQALTLLEFEMVAAMLSELSWFLADAGLGLLIFAAGVYFGGLAARAIRSSGAEHATLFSAVAEGAILILAVALALRQLGLPEDLINLAFGLLLGALAVAGAIAFGFGGRELAARYLAKWVENLEKKEP